MSISKEYWSTELQLLEPVKNDEPEPVKNDELQLLEPVKNDEPEPESSLLGFDKACQEARTWIIRAECALNALSVEDSCDARERFKEFLNNVIFVVLKEVKTATELGSQTAAEEFACWLQT